LPHGISAEQLVFLLVEVVTEQGKPRLDAHTKSIRTGAPRLGEVRVTAIVDLGDELLQFVALNGHDLVVCLMPLHAIASPSSD
jgi:hypothetical protein